MKSITGKQYRKIVHEQYMKVSASHAILGMPYLKEHYVI